MEDDPTAVATELFGRLEHAWNEGDGPAFGEPFAEETDFVDIRGVHHHGNAEMVGAGHQAILDSIYQNSKVRYAVTGARALSPTTILVIATATLDAPQGPLAGVNSSLITAVLSRAGARWAITAFQNTLVAA